MHDNIKLSKHNVIITMVTYVIVLHVQVRFINS